MAKKKGTPSSKPKKRQEAPKEEKKQASTLSKASRLQEASAREGRFSRKVIERKLGEYRRVLTLTRRPTREEFSTIAKVAAIGIAIIGVGGFLIYLVMVQAPQSLGLTNATHTTATATPSTAVNASEPVINATQNSSISSAVNTTGSVTTQSATR
ncbi:MAG TPA: protein translocase SEC61 complex subunit gamma [Candidatus Bathyarchaeia archaeon]|nr:protein translocase SEC61 complex subunit gamma [Candidatus Bathyarchaeia archaeon]